MAQSLTNYTKWMKERYWPAAKGGMEEAFYRSEGLLARLMKKDASDLLQGKQLIVPVHKSRTRTGGPRGEAGTTRATLPTASNQGVDYFTFTTVIRYWPISITGHIIDLAKGPTSAFANAFDFEVRNATRDARDDMNMAAFGDGSSQLARIPSGANSADQTVDDTRLLEVGMTVNVVQGTSGNIITSGVVTISAINHTTKVVTLSGSVDTTGGSGATCGLYRPGGTAASYAMCFENDIWGLQLAVHDGTALTSDAYGPIRTGVLTKTYAGVTDRSAAGSLFAASKLVDAGAQPPSEDLLMRVWNVMRIRGAKPTIAITSEQQWRAIGQMLHGPVVWNNFVKKIDFGYEALSFRGVDIIWEAHCQPTVMYILDESAFYWGEIHPLGFMNYDGQDWVRSATEDQINAQLKWAGQLINTNPYGQVKLYNLPTGTTIFE